MSESLTGVLAVAAITLGSLHTIAPDHWVPFAALARAQGWSRAKTARITAICGFGHVTVSALLGLLALFFGLEMLRLVGQRMESIAGLLLILFGLVYAVYGLRRAAGAHVHGHHHAHYDHVHEPHKMTPWALFLLFSRLRRLARCARPSSSPPTSSRRSGRWWLWCCRPRPLRRRSPVSGSSITAMPPPAV
jgi:ABC-type nickel/cobalt efflux system permease component RcnA